MNSFHALQTYLFNIHFYNNFSHVSQITPPGFPTKTSQEFPFPHSQSEFFKVVAIFCEIYCWNVSHTEAEFISNGISWQ